MSCYTARTVTAPRYALHALRCALGASLLAIGCGGWRGDVYRAARVPAKRARMEATYRVGDPGGGWRRAAQVDGTQVAWHNPDLAGVIQVHSSCADHGDSSLDQYTDHLRIDWTDWKVLSQREERLVGRAALRTVVDAQLDGVERRQELVVVKKNGCIFDLRYAARPATFDQGRAAFGRVVAGFRFPAGS